MGTMIKTYRLVKGQENVWDEKKKKWGLYITKQNLWNQNDKVIINKANYKNYFTIYTIVQFIQLKYLQL